MSHPWNLIFEITSVCRLYVLWNREHYFGFVLTLTCWYPIRDLSESFSSKTMSCPFPSTIREGYRMMRYRSICRTLENSDIYFRWYRKWYISWICFCSEYVHATKRYSVRYAAQNIFLSSTTTMCIIFSSTSRYHYFYLNNPSYYYNPSMTSRHNNIIIITSPSAEG